MRSVFTTEPAVSPLATIDLEDLGLDRGAHILIDRALRALPIGARLEVRGRDPALGVHLRAWGRQHGHRFEELPRSEVSPAFVLTRGEADRVNRMYEGEAAGSLTNLVGLEVAD